MLVAHRMGTRSPSVDFRQAVEAYEVAVKDYVLTVIGDMSPQAFEQFAGRLLSSYGFVDVAVTGKVADGGIDGHGKLPVGLALMDVAFQCKRWQSNVSGPTVDSFRGTIQGRYEQGVMFATSGFTKPARDKSIQKGAVPIVLIDGIAIVELMIEKALYVRRRPLYLYDIVAE